MEQGVFGGFNGFKKGLVAEYVYTETEERVDASESIHSHAGCGSVGWVGKKGKRYAWIDLSGAYN